MTQGPDDQPEHQPEDQPQDQPQDQPPPPPPGYEQQAYQQGYQQGYPQAYPQPGYGYAQPVPGAPYGIHPATGIPYSEKSKLVAGLLQVLLPLGIGRFYIGDTGIGIAQLLVTIFTCGIGALWPFIDGIIMLVTDSKDAQGRMLRT